MNFSTYLDEWAQLTPQAAALHFADECISYADLGQQVRRAAAVFAGRGLQRGARIVIALSNCPLFVVAYLAALRLGAIAVSVNPALRPAELKHILADSGASLLLAEAMPAVEVHARDGRMQVLLANESAPTGLSLPLLMRHASAWPQPAGMHSSDPAAILYTSGTTGEPKGAVLTHGNIASNIRSVRELSGMRPGETLLLFLPLFHCFGQNFVLNAGLSAGACIVLQPRFEPEQAVQAIACHGVSMLFAVPVALARLLAMQGAAQQPLRDLRYVFSAAAPMPQTLAMQWREQYGHVIHEGYGLTETSPCATYNHADSHRPGSVGRALPGVELRIADEDGHSLPPGGTGEILIRGPNVMTGYWNRPRETAQAFHHGWFRSGDLGHLDDDGYLHVVDRLKDMVNVSGFKVYPAEVERVLESHPLVAEAAVYGTQDARTGEAVHACITCRDDSRPVAELIGELRQHCDRHLAPYKQPRSVQVIKEIPRNPTGKILKSILREQHSAPPTRPESGR